MKYDIYDPKTHDETIHLALQRDGSDGDIMLVAVDEAGGPLPNGLILGVTPYGTIQVYGAVRGDLGLKLDEGGHITVEKE